jgi:hypothetical protein
MEGVDQPMPKIIKKFTIVIYKCLQLARVLVRGKPFHLGLMFVGEAGAYLSVASL